MEKTLILYRKLWNAWNFDLQSKKKCGTMEKDMQLWEKTMALQKKHGTIVTYSLLQYFLLSNASYADFFG